MCFFIPYVSCSLGEVSVLKDGLRLHRHGGNLAALLGNDEKPRSPSILQVFEGFHLLRLFFLLQRLLHCFHCQAQVGLAREVFDEVANETAYASRTD